MSYLMFSAKETMLNGISIESNLPNSTSLFYVPLVYIQGHYDKDPCTVSITLCRMLSYLK